MRTIKHYLLFAGLSCLGSLLCFASGQGSKAQKSARDDQTIKVAVEMVSLPVVVTDRSGKRITDLKKEDFEVFEDGIQ